MAGEIVASDELLRERADKLRELFDAGHALYLFSNDFKPTPSSKLADFIEAAFPAYTRKALAGNWKPVFKAKSGEWQFSSKELTWIESATTDVVVYGWYIVGSGKVKLSCRLPFGKPMNGPTSLTVRVDAQVWATAIL